MSALSKSELQTLVHEALAARVRVLLEQCTFDELIATQARVSQALAVGAPVCQPPGDDAARQALASAVMAAFTMDPSYYVGAGRDFLVSESLTTVGLALADVIRGHERSSRARWQATVVPQLDRIEAFVVSVFDGSWGRSTPRVSLGDWLRQAA